MPQHITREQKEEIVKYYLEKFGDGGLRYWLEQQIIASEINKLK